MGGELAAALADVLHARRGRRRVRQGARARRRADGRDRPTRRSAATAASATRRAPSSALIASRERRGPRLSGALEEDLGAGGLSVAAAAHLDRDERGGRRPGQDQRHALDDRRALGDLVGGRALGRLLGALGRLAGGLELRGTCPERRRPGPSCSCYVVASCRTPYPRTARRTRITIAAGMRFRRRRPPIVELLSGVERRPAARAARRAAGRRPHDPLERGRARRRGVASRRRDGGDRARRRARRADRARRRPATPDARGALYEAARADGIVFALDEALDALARVGRGRRAGRRAGAPDGERGAAPRAAQARDLAARPRRRRARRRRCWRPSPATTSSASSPASRSPACSTTRSRRGGASAAWRADGAASRPSAASRTWTASCPTRCAPGFSATPARNAELPDHLAHRVRDRRPPRDRARRARRRRAARRRLHDPQRAGGGRPGARTWRTTSPARAWPSPCSTCSPTARRASCACGRSSTCATGPRTTSSTWRSPSAAAACSAAPRRARFVAGRLERPGEVLRVWGDRRVDGLRPVGGRAGATSSRRRWTPSCTSSSRGRRTPTAGRA